MAKSKIRTIDEFRTVLQTLYTDVATASDHFALFQKLLAAREGAYTKAVSQSQTFWWLTMQAQFDAAVFRLCRAYDQDLDNLALKGFLLTIQEHPELLPKPILGKKLDACQLANDLALADEDKTPRVKTLMMWRHKVYGHRDIRKTLMGNLADEYPLMYEDVRILLETAFNIVNRYNHLFLGVLSARQMDGLGDYEKVLRTLQDSVEAIEAQFAAQLQRLREAE